MHLYRTLTLFVLSTHNQDCKTWLCVFLILILYNIYFYMIKRKHHFPIILTNVSYVNLAPCLKPDIKLSALLVVENSI